MNYRTPKLENVKVKFLRKKYGNDFNIEKWVKDENNFYIGRRMRIFIYFPDKTKKIYHLKNSKYYNPFKVTKDISRDKVVKKFEKYARKQFVKEEILKDLSGKTLGCWCHPESCHGDTLIKLFEEYSK